jgi:hypothetical protein
MASPKDRLRSRSRGRSDPGTPVVLAVRGDTHGGRSVAAAPLALSHWLVDVILRAMPYTLELAALVANQLERIATYQEHQLVGQVVNLEFWIHEALHAIHVIEDYPDRFVRLHDAQTRWVDAHGTMVFNVDCAHCGGRCVLPPEPPPPPRRISNSDLSRARRSVTDGAYHLLRRLYRAGWIDEARLRAACDQLGTSVDLADLDRR